MYSRSNGVLCYKTGIAQFCVSFPDGKADCRHCRFLRYSENRKLHSCILTDAFVEHYELDGRHEACPICFHDEEEKKEEGK